jgi:two-component system NtrC family sensor kinase
MLDTPDHQQAQPEAPVVNEKAARERLEALLAFAPAFILGIDLDGTINFINRLLPQYTMKDVLGTSWLHFFEPERHATMEAALRNTYATGAAQTYEVATPGPDGAMLWFSSQIAPVRIGGQIVGAVLVSQDVTEKKRQDTELAGARHMALLGTLAAGVAHEINTPIQFVGDSLQFLREASRDLLEMLAKLKELRSEAVKGAPHDEIMIAIDKAENDADLPYLRENMPAAFEVCVEGLNRVTNIVRSLKEFAHPAENQMVPADLNRAIQSTLTLTTNEYKYVAELTTDFGDLPPVTCHLSEINQAVLNIVVNAAHAIGDVVKGSDRKGLISV